MVRVDGPGGLALPQVDRTGVIARVPEKALTCLQELATCDRYQGVAATDGQFEGNSLVFETPVAPPADAVVRRRRATTPLAAPPQFPTPTLGQPVDLNRETLVSLFTPDTAPHLDDTVHLDREQPMTSWDEFPAILGQVRAQQIKDHKHVTLLFTVHGNCGTGMKLLTLHPDKTATASIASVAWINEQLRQAGFSPNDVTIVLEACNGRSSYASTVDGMNLTERKAAVSRFHTLARKEGFKPGEMTFHDVLANPGKKDVALADRSFMWVGRQTGVAFVGGVIYQYLSNTGVRGVVAPGKATVHGSGVAVPGKALPRSSELIDFRPITKTAYSGRMNFWGNNLRHIAHMRGLILDAAPRLAAKPAPPPTRRPTDEEKAPPQAKTKAQAAATSSRLPETGDPLPRRDAEVSAKPLPLRKPHRPTIATD